MGFLSSFSFKLLLSIGLSSCRFFELLRQLNLLLPFPIFLLGNELPHLGLPLRLFLRIGLSLELELLVRLLELPFLLLLACSFQVFDFIGISLLVQLLLEILNDSLVLVDLLLGLGFHFSFDLFDHLPKSLVLLSFLGVVSGFHFIGNGFHVILGGENLLKVFDIILGFLHDTQLQRHGLNLLLSVILLSLQVSDGLLQVVNRLVRLLSLRHAQPGAVVYLRDKPSIFLSGWLFLVIWVHDGVQLLVKHVTSLGDVRGGRHLLRLVRLSKRLRHFSFCLSFFALRRCFLVRLQERGVFIWSCNFRSPSLVLQRLNYLLSPNHVLLLRITFSIGLRSPAESIDPLRVTAGISFKWRVNIGCSRRSLGSPHHI